MMNRVTIYILLLLGVVWCGSVSAQNLPHRKQVRQGNKAFAQERYEKSADTYQQALKHDSTLYEARYNLGNAYIKTKRWADAQEALQRALTDSTRTDRELAAAYYNLGYAQFMQGNLHQSLESFRRSLVLNSEDMNAKYNYVYVRTRLEQQQNQGGGDGGGDSDGDGDGDGGGDGDDQSDQNDQNKDNQNDKQNQNDNHNNPDKPKDNQDDKQNDNQSDDKQNDKQNDNQNDKSDDKQNDNQSGGGDDKDEESDSQPEGGESPSGMTPEQREQMLDAIQAQEDKTQQKVDDADKKRGILIRGKKNW